MLAQAAFYRDPICSGLRFGIVHPEVVLLRIAIGKVRAADALYPLQHAATRHYAPAQINAVLPAVPANHVVNSGKAQAAGVDVAVIHGE